MKKNLILMSALFAGSMFMNNGFCANDGFGGNYVIDIDDDQNDEEFTPPKNTNDDHDDCSYNPSKEEFFNDIENLYYDNIENPIVRTDIKLTAAQNDLKKLLADIDLYIAQNDLKKLIETEYTKLPLTKRINKKIKKSFHNVKVIKRTITTVGGILLSEYIMKRLALSL